MAGPSRDGTERSALGLVRLGQFLARRRADELRATEELLALQRGPGTVLAAQEARHRRGREGACRTERRPRRFRAVAQSVRVDGRLDLVFGHGGKQLLERQKPVLSSTWACG